MFYSKKTEYLIQALLVIADSYDTGIYVSVDTIRQKADLPRALTLKLLNSLVKDKILESNLGPAGGFRFVKAPSEVYLYQIKSYFDPVSHLEGCALGLSFCSEERPCALHETWKGLRQPIRDFFETTSVQALVAEYRKNNRLLGH
ncbi:MAG: Rrf2 family transcriptional regulator [Bacteroidetes bacterium]|nr:Rrf2 family transcriptional regulator [Bacteroidota bacterium]